MSSSALSPGTVVGGYAVVRPIGMGGLGVVYEARHQRLDKPVAVKALQTELLSDPNAIERFLREGRTAAKLQHPNVVDVSDVALDGDTPYLVMELLQGEDLACLIAREGYLNVETTIDLLVPIVSALRLAHDRGIVHRDLKPRNIFLNRSALGTVIPKVVDFGISKILDEPVSDLTRSNAFVGTPHYTSPEQARGDRQVDHLCDQFSLGVIAYECMTGIRPFKGDSLFTVLSSVIGHEPPPVDALRPEVPSEVAAVIAQLMAKSPTDRFENMQAVGRALLPYASSRVRLAYDREFASAAAVALPSARRISPVRDVPPRLGSTARLSGLRRVRESFERTVTDPLRGVKGLRRTVKLGAVALAATLGLAGASSPLTRDPTTTVRQATEPAATQTPEPSPLVAPGAGPSIARATTIPAREGVQNGSTRQAASARGPQSHSPRRPDATARVGVRSLGRPAELKASANAVDDQTIQNAPAISQHASDTPPSVASPPPERGVNGALILR